jgi:hypothetical protein
MPGKKGSGMQFWVASFQERTSPNGVPSQNTPDYILEEQEECTTLQTQQFRPIFTEIC